MSSRTSFLLSLLIASLFAQSAVAASASSTSLDPAQQTAAIAVGDTVNGALDIGDARSRLASEAYADNYLLTLTTAQSIRIVLTSESFDTFVAVFSTGGVLLADNDDIADIDDASDSTDSRLDITLEAGEYIIEAASFEDAQSGPYTLSVSSLGPAKPVVALSAPQTVQDMLEPTDNRTFFADGSFADYYAIEIAETQSLTITARSTEFNTYLLLGDISRGHTVENNSGGGGTDASISIVLEPGEYFLEVTSFSPGEQGTYTLTISAPGPATPLISAEGVVSSAGFIGGSVSPGEILSFFGVEIGPEELAGLEFGEDGLVRTEIGGTRILFDGAPAPMVFSIANQASAVAPFFLNDQVFTEIRIEKDGRLSNAIELPVAAVRPTIFSINQSGTGPGAVLNQDFSLNSADNPAAPGTALQIFLTGGGVTNPPSEDGGLAPSAAPLAELLADVTVTIGGQPAQVLYKGGAPGLINGLVQVNALVAEGTPTGDAIEVIVTIGGVASQAGITVAIQ